jgi:tartrate dehydrogenase/decarboxylase/D-malate dehydrogenase
VGGRFNEGTEDEAVVHERIFTRRGVDRALRFAYELRSRPLSGI